jgi:CDP-diacylglycerol--serine O-phosphatidyltransferase
MVPVSVAAFGNSAKIGRCGIILHLLFATLYYSTMYQPPHNKGLLHGNLRRRGIYWLPNLFTTAALFAGFYAIVQAMNGNFQPSAIAIFVATALVAYVWALYGFGSFKGVAHIGWLGSRLGWVAAFIYCACAALRLARFNTQLEVADKRFFQGLPSPAAASLIAGMVWAFDEYGVTGAEAKWVAWAITVFAGLSMVTSLKFYSGKDINLRKSVPFNVVVLIAIAVMALVLFSSRLPEILFLLFVSYALSGYVTWVWERRQRRRLPPPDARSD